MVKVFISLVLALVCVDASASSFIAYKCASSVDAQESFPVFLENGSYRAASSMGSTSYFDLEQIPTSDLNGWPSYPGGVYYRGANDLWVIFSEGNSLRILKPLNNLPTGVTYSCLRTL